VARRGNQQAHRRGGAAEAEGLIRLGRLDAKKIGSKIVITAESIERLIAELPRVGRQP